MAGSGGPGRRSRHPAPISYYLPFFEYHCANTSLLRAWST
jgi:hypothetical protein